MPESERRARIEAIFEAALELPPGERSGWVREACASEPEMVAEVEALLRAHERGAGILEGSPEVLAEEIAAAVSGAPASNPVRIGPYRVVREIGRGGMGTVYLAERADEHFEQRVAIKLVRRGLDTEEIVQRFLAERRILASLEHPSIARLLDGGITEDGRPYLVMEYIAGEPIDRYCDSRRLTIEERIRLFVAVCRAVHHAHRNLVVHRDLKPSNILVSAAGEVKLVDFGIAKPLTEEGAIGTSPRTRTGVRLLTPEYASPEQVRGDRVTTTSDVYALGLVLYELLCGRRAIRTEGRAPGDVERAILEEEPPRPSSVVLSTEGVASGRAGEETTPESIAWARRSEPRRLSRQLRGDLDRIVGMALRKEPDRRYPSANQLADDLENYLSGRPVRAQGDATLYRLGKFVRRHRWGVAAAAAFIVLLAGYAVTVTVQSRRIREALESARLEAAKAEQVTAFLMDLFRANHPGETAGESVTAGELMRRGVERTRELANQPLVQAQMLGVIGGVYLSLGQYEAAESLTRRALEIRREVLGPTHPDVARGLLLHGSTLAEAGRYDDAEAELREAVRIARVGRPESDSLLAATLSRLGAVLTYEGEFREAEPIIVEAQAIRRRLYRGDHPELAEALQYLAGIAFLKGDLDRAEALALETLEMRRRIYGRDHPQLVSTLQNVATLRQHRGDAAGALPLLREGLAMSRRLYGESHPNMANLLEAIGNTLLELEKPGEAATVLAESLEMRRRLLGADHPEISSTLAVLARALHRAGRVAEADSLFREALVEKSRVVGEGHPTLVWILLEYAAVLRERGELPAAEAKLMEAYGIQDRPGGAPDPDALRRTLVDLIQVQQQLGREAEADRYRARLAELQAGGSVVP